MFELLCLWDQNTPFPSLTSFDPSTLLGIIRELLHVAPDHRPSFCSHICNKRIINSAVVEGGISHKDSCESFLSPDQTNQEIKKRRYFPSLVIVGVSLS